MRSRLLLYVSMFVSLCLLGLTSMGCGGNPNPCGGSSGFFGGPSFRAPHQGCGQKPQPKACIFNGKRFEHGDKMPPQDCNGCSCMNGSRICTSMRCPTKTCSPKVPCAKGLICVYNVGACGEYATGICSSEKTRFEEDPGVCHSGTTPYCGCDGKTFMKACGQHIAKPTRHRGKCHSVCAIGDRVYKAGESFPSPHDTCNSCYCSIRNGVAGYSCTKKACSTGYTCTYKGKKYKLHDKFVATDGCNICKCGEWGKLTCTTGSCGALRRCSENGRVYEVGAAMPKPANKPGSAECVEKCYCGKDGFKTCIKAPCHTIPKCSYNGKAYNAGDNFPAGDGCNTCTCKEDGSFICTGRSCTVYCGGKVGNTCPGDLFCKYEIQDRCGVGDQQGICTRKPTGCGKIKEPVCGCDNRTYSNPCLAAAAGVSLLHSGACKAP